MFHGHGIIVMTLVSCSAWASSATVPHIQANLRRSVESAEVGAVVRVLPTEVEGTARLLVVREVMGKMAVGEPIEVSARKFVASDLSPGTELLVFFRQRSGARLSPTGNYELIDEGRIREVPAREYLSRTRAYAQWVLRTRSASAAQARPDLAAQGRQGRKLAANTAAR